MSYGSSITGGALSGGATGATIGSMFAPGIGTAIGGGAGLLLGGLGGLLGASEAEERQKQANRLAAELESQGRLGSQQMFRAAEQQIGQRAQALARGRAHQAARRGVLHSGALGAATRDIGRRREQALTQARGASQQYLLDALLKAGQLRNQAAYNEAQASQIRMPNLMPLAYMLRQDYLQAQGQPNSNLVRL